ncbi:MAG: SDR family NAD(P)-dependent oxidoreductase, partial [Thermoanaerobaculia bacterium]
MTVGPLAGKAALVTGAGVRVGKAIALALAEAGADVAVHHRSSAGPAEETAAAIRKLGRKAVVLRAELAAEAQCAELVRAAIAGLG